MNLWISIFFLYPKGHPVLVKFLMNLWISIVFPPLRVISNKSQVSHELVDFNFCCFIKIYNSSWSSFSWTCGFQFVLDLLIQFLHRQVSHELVDFNEKMEMLNIKKNSQVSHELVDFNYNGLWFYCWMSMSSFLGTYSFVYFL